VGAIAAGLAAVGLLTNAAVILAFTFAVSSRRPLTPSMLLAALDVVLILALLVAGLLILLKRDAGRSAAVWISASALPWAIFTTVATFAAATTNTSRELSWAPALGVVGAATGVLGLLGLIGTMIAFGIRPSRRWMALHSAGGPVRPGRLTFMLAAVLGIAGSIILFAMLPFTPLGQSPGTDIATIVYAVILFVLVIVPTGLGLVGGTIARTGKRGGATLARIAGGFAVIGFPAFTVMTVLMMVGSADSSNEEKAAAAIPLAATLVVGAAIGLASLAGLALYIAGLAGVASPRAELFYRRPVGYLVGAQPGTWLMPAPSAEPWQYPTSH
jgi:hypothetical protein